MFINMPEAHKRSVTKAITWRLLGSLDTFVIGAILTHNFVIAGSIAGVETFTKLALYYAHERVWQIVPWGRKPAATVLSEAPQPIR